MYTKRAELKAGLLVLIALGAFLYLVYKASGSRLPWTEGERIHLRFEQGFTAPVAGDALLMNGVKIGFVSSVTQAVEIRGKPGPDGKTIPLTDQDRARLKLRPDEPGVAREVYVKAAVELTYEDQVIPKGTVALIDTNITGARRLSLLPGLSLEDIDPKATEADPIRASAAGDLAQIQRKFEEMASKIGNLADSASVAILDARGMIADLREKIRVIDIAEIQGNVLAGSKDLRETLALVKVRVDEIFAKVLAAAGNAETLTAGASRDVSEITAGLKEVVGHLKSASAQADAVIARAAEGIDVILADVKEAARAAATTLKQFDGIGGRVEAVVGSAGDKIDTMLDKLLEAAHNLADATEDIRAHPWKLTTKPEDKEIAFENVRNAATNYVRAMQAVRESLRTLASLEARADVTDVERKALIVRAKALLEADLAKADQTGQALSRALQSGGLQAPR
jgi:hypothetical protein